MNELYYDKGWLKRDHVTQITNLLMQLYYLLCHLKENGLHTTNKPLNFREP